MMNHELNRLASFADFPHSNNALPSRLARAGFYVSAGQNHNGDQVQCFRCGLQVGGWGEGRQSPSQEHASLSPHCLLVSGSDTENVPFSVTPEAQRAHAELKRTGCVPNTVHSNTSGPAGGISNNTNQTVHGKVDLPSASDPSCSRLESTQGRLELLRQTSGPGLLEGRPPASNTLSGSRVVHRQVSQPMTLPSHTSSHTVNSPSCSTTTTASKSSSEVNTQGRLESLLASSGPVVRPGYTSGPVSVTSTNTVSTQGPTPLDIVPTTTTNTVVLQSLPSTTAPPNEPVTNELQVSNEDSQPNTMIVVARHPEYSTLTARLTTYGGWPIGKEQTARCMAQSGFFYTGDGDSVRCHFCHGGLQNWLPGDNPWVEHARWFPRCSFVARVQGHDFIQVVAMGNNVEPRRAVEEEPLSIASEPSRTGTTLVSRSVTVRSIQPTRETVTPATSTAASQSVTTAAAAATSASVSGEQAAQTSRKKKKKSKPSEDTQLQEQLATLLQQKQDIEERNQELREAEKCKVCMDEDIAIVFLPCGHRVTCASCAANLRDCPICRVLIRGTVKTYLV